MLEDDSGQVSAEMIIVMAALLAVAMIFVTNLGKTVEDASTKMKTKSGDVLKEIDKI